MGQNETELGYHQEALTLAEYRKLKLTRPLTDKAVGAHTHGRRQMDANASACFPADHDIRTGRNPNVTGIIDVNLYDRERKSKKRPSVDTGGPVIRDRKPRKGSVCPLGESTGDPGTDTTQERENAT